MLIRELILPDGRSPFADWFSSLDPVEAAKVTASLLRLEEGNLSAVRWFSGIGECRIHWGPGLRVYLAREGKTLLLLLGGGTKRRQQRDIEEAVRLWKGRHRKEGK